MRFIWAALLHAECLAKRLNKPLTRTHKYVYSFGLRLTCAPVNYDVEHLPFLISTGCSWPISTNQSQRNGKP